MKTTTRRYEGSINKGAISVKVDGRALPLRLGVRNHSPTGFSWGYNGSGPAQLALAILCDHLRAFAHDIPLAILAFVGGAKFTLDMMRRGRGPAQALRAWLGVPLSGGIEDVHRAWVDRTTPAQPATTGAAR